MGIDEGTTSLRVGLFDVDSYELVFKSQREISLACPHNGWVEQDANEIYDNLLLAIDDVILNNNIDVKSILAISITNQRETTVAWDKETGISIEPAINWQCRRTSKIIDNLSKEQKDFIKHTTGLIPDGYFSASKIKWFVENSEKVKDLALNNKLAFGTIESYLIYRMTKGRSFVTDAVNASRTMLMDLNKCCWDDKCLQIFGVDKNWLGKIVCNDEVVGYFELKGIVIPICGVIGDQQSSLFGHACFDAGFIKNTYGTGCFMLMNTGNQIVYSDKLISTIGYKLKNESPVYALEGSVFNGGSCIGLLQDWGLIENPTDSQTFAQSVSDSGKVVFVPALTGLGAPYWDMQARGLLIGITRATRKEHIIRAVIESIGFSCFDIILEMGKHIDEIKQLRCDGGMSGNEFLMQFQSDIALTNIAVAKEYEVTLLGSIYLAMCSLKLTDKFEISKKYQVSKTYRPQLDSESIKRKYTRWKRAVIRSLEWIE